jgi:hypothetical protein
VGDGASSLKTESSSDNEKPAERRSRLAIAVAEGARPPACACAVGHRRPVARARGCGEHAEVSPNARCRAKTGSTTFGARAIDDDEAKKFSHSKGGAKKNHRHQRTTSQTFKLQTFCMSN